ncbi:MAG: rhomboid family intramembrane serine protease [Spirochaeta sp.]|nr:rhomboid family intramembrane serine protease [Spirochaeta sp.]
MRISYNAPVTLSFAVLSTAILVIDMLTGRGLTAGLFSVGPSMSFAAPLDYLRLVTHVAGHANWNHLMGNFAFILLLGPILEEKYGTLNITVMILITALVTGLLNVLFLSTGLMGASGIVFMMILLVSFTNFRRGEIPLTFILIVLLFLTREIITAVDTDGISQFAHIFGGVCGSLFGFLRPARSS